MGSSRPLRPGRGPDRKLVPLVQCPRWPCACDRARGCHSQGNQLSSSRGKRNRAGPEWTLEVRVPWRCTSVTHGGAFPAQHQLQVRQVRRELRDEGIQEGNDIPENTLMTAPAGLPLQTLTFTCTRTEVLSGVRDGRCIVTGFRGEYRMSEKEG